LPILSLIRHTEKKGRKKTAGMQGGENWAARAQSHRRYQRGKGRGKRSLSYLGLRGRGKKKGGPHTKKGGEVENITPPVPLAFRRRKKGGEKKRGS